MRVPQLSPVFLEDLTWWIKHDRKVALRLMRIIDETLRDPFGGIGKPEPLRHLGGSHWSKRLTKGNRIVYVVFEQRVDFLQACYHY